MSEQDHNIVDKLDKTLSKIKRCETSLENIVKGLSDTQSKLSEDSGRLTLEVEGITNIKKEITVTVSEIIENKLNLIIPQFTQLIVKDVENKLKDTNSSTMEKIKIASGSAQEIIMNANKIMNEHKKELTIRRMWIGAMFLIGSMITAGGIFYFFPQNIHYNMDGESMKTYRVGKIVRENFNDLSSKDKKIIQDKYELYKD